MFFEILQWHSTLGYGWFYYCDVITFYVLKKCQMSCRRQKVATALLKACEMVANLWGFEYLVLRAYEDDWGARKLYSNAGYRVVSKDPPWISSWIGRRRRVLMIKRSKDHLYTKYQNYKKMFDTMSTYKCVEA